MPLKTIHFPDRILDISQPVVMGILNLTPDSFFDGGYYDSLAKQMKQIEKMLREGASIIDIGAVSTRPSVTLISEEEEIGRLFPFLQSVRKTFPDALLSIDTFRSRVAAIAVEHGVSMINDIFSGRKDEKIFDVVRKTKVPYVMMHMQGTPMDMQQNPHYTDVVEEVKEFFRNRLAQFDDNSAQIIIDPGFGFGKSNEHNYQLLSRLNEFHSFGFPVMAGISRKSMINKVLHIRAQSALNGTSVLNTVAIVKGADILRVHDVRQAVEVIRLISVLDQFS